MRLGIRIWFLILIAQIGKVMAEPYTIPAQWVQDPDVIRPYTGSFSFDDLSFASSNDGWIVGYKYLLHIRGDALDVTFVNATDMSVDAIAASSLSHAWAGGTQGSRAREVRHGALWEYREGQGWKVVELPEVHDGPWSISVVAAAEGQTGLWVALREPENNRLRYLNGTFGPGQFVLEPAPDFVGGYLPLKDICFQKSGTAWGVGVQRDASIDQIRPLVVERRDNVWHPLSLPDAMNSGVLTLFQAACVDTGLIVGGNRLNERGLAGPGAIYRYRGEWEELRLPAHYETYSLAALAAVDMDDFWVGIDCTSETEGCVPRVLHFDKGEWTETPLPLLPGGRRDGYSISGLAFPSRDAGWMIANDYMGTALVEGLIFQYKDGHWVRRNWDWHFWDQRWFGLFGD